jgi:hypothetical protein
LAQTKALAKTLPFRLTDALIFGKLGIADNEFPTLAIAPVTSPLLQAGFLLSGVGVPFRTKLTTRATQSLAAQVCG